MWKNNQIAAMIIDGGPVDWNRYFPEHFIYTPTEGLITAPVAVGAVPGTAQGNVQINSDAPFMLFGVGVDLLLPEWEDLTAATMPSYAPTQFIPNARVQFTDQGSATNLFNAPIPLRQICGASGSDVHQFLAPRILGANTTMQVTLTNFDTVNAMPAFFSFVGVKIKPRAIPRDVVQAERERESLQRLASSIR